MKDFRLRERFASLAIPPEWRDVRIRRRQNGEIVVTGRDENGLEQRMHRAIPCGEHGDDRRGAQVRRKVRRSDVAGRAGMCGSRTMHLRCCVQEEAGHDAEGAMLPEEAALLHYLERFVSAGGDLA